MNPFQIFASRKDERVEIRSQEAVLEEILHNRRRIESGRGLNGANASLQLAWPVLRESLTIPTSVLIRGQSRDLTDLGETARLERSSCRSKRVLFLLDDDDVTSFFISRRLDLERDSMRIITNFLRTNYLHVQTEM